MAEKTGKAKVTKQLEDDFVALFNQNNVWLLLDGLDEMSASSGNPLAEIARQFREAGSISQARIVLTCRVNLWEAAESLWEINPGNEIAIATLVQLLQSKNIKKHTRRLVAESLGKIDTSNGKAIAALLQLLIIKNVDDDIRSQAAFSLGKILQNNKYFFEAVKILSGYWRLYSNNYDLAWKCAQNMPYPKFYQAWHQHNVATRAMQSLNKILFTKRI